MFSYRYAKYQPYIGTKCEQLFFDEWMVISKHTLRPTQADY